MKNNGSSYSITWTNLDMIHRSAKNGNCKLKKKNRKALHDTDIKILSKEIEIFLKMLLLIPVAQNVHEF